MKYLRLYQIPFTLIVLFVYLQPLIAIDQYYKFPEKSYKGYVEFEQSRKFCIFSFLPKQSNPKYEYLSKGLPSVVFSGLRDLDYIFIENPKPDIVYHSFGKNPVKSLQEMIDEDSQNSKKKKKEINDQSDLNALNAGKKSVIPEKDPRHIKLILKQLTDIKPPKKEDSFALVNKHSCDYILTGEYEIQGDSLQIQMYLFREFDAKTIDFKHTTSLIRAYQEMEPLLLSLRNQMYGKETTTVDILTPGLDSSLVYLNGVYLGKAPVLNKKFPVGKATLYVFKEGYASFKKEIVLEKNNNFRLEVVLLPETNSSFLSVYSNEESDVYLGVQYLGKTPLVRVSVPKGMNRLRVSKEGFIDVFRPVDLEDGKEENVRVNMRTGKTDIYYKNKQNVFLDHTYKDFSTYSLYGALLFYASYAYLNYASNQAYEAARPQVSLVNASVLTNFYATNPNEFALWYYYQNKIIDDATDKARNLKLAAGTLPIENRRDRQFVLGPMVFGMGLMLVSAATFYWLGIDDEAVDIGFVPVQPLGTERTSGQDSYSYMQFNLKF